MGAIEDVRSLVQDFVAPEIKGMRAEIKALVERVDAIEGKLIAMDSKFDKLGEKLENRLDKHHEEQMDAIRQLSNYLNLADRVAKIESKVQ